MHLYWLAFATRSYSTPRQSKIVLRPSVLAYRFVKNAKPSIRISPRSTNLPDCLWDQVRANVAHAFAKLFGHSLQCGRPSHEYLIAWAPRRCATSIQRRVRHWHSRVKGKSQSCYTLLACRCQLVLVPRGDLAKACMSPACQVPATRE